MNPVCQRIASRLLCTNCGAEIPPPQQSIVDYADVSCPCGFSSQVVREVCRRQIFEWCFDFGAHTIFWDITALLAEYESMTKGDIPISTLPAHVVRFLWEQNKCREDISTDMPTVSSGFPVLITPHPSAAAHEMPFPYLVLDGWHRIYQAQLCNETLPCIVVDPCIERKHRIMDIIHLSNGDCPIWDGSGPTVLESMEEMSSEKVLLSQKTKPTQI